jgi:hypothetical protein
MGYGCSGHGCPGTDPCPLCGEGGGGISIAGGRFGALPVVRAKIKERSWVDVGAYLQMCDGCAGIWYEVQYVWAYDIEETEEGEVLRVCV